MRNELTAWIYVGGRLARTVLYGSSVKKTATKKLLLKNEKVRELSAQKLEATAGGDYAATSTAANSAGNVGTRPRNDPDFQQFNFNYYYFGG